MIRSVPRGIETRSVSEEMIYVPRLRFALTIERVVLARAKYSRVLSPQDNPCAVLPDNPIAFILKMNTISLHSFDDAPIATGDARLERIGKVSTRIVFHRFRTLEIHECNLILPICHCRRIGFDYEATPCRQRDFFPPLSSSRHSVPPNVNSSLFYPLVAEEQRLKEGRSVSGVGGASKPVFYRELEGWPCGS